MWFAQDVKDCLARTETLCRNNIPCSGYELVSTAYLYHLCWLSKAWHFVFINAVFGGWLVDCLNFIFGNTIKTFCRNNLPGFGNEPVATAYLYHLYQISKSLRFGFGNVELLATVYLDCLCRVSKAWCFGLVNSVFWGWLSYCRNLPRGRFWWC